MSSSNFNLVLPKVKFQYIEATPDHIDTRELRECPSCKGAGEFTYWMDGANTMVSEPCAHCDGRAEVLNGIGFNPKAGEFEVWVCGEMNWAEDESIAQKMYVAGLIAFRKHWERLDLASQEIPF